MKLFGSLTGLTLNRNRNKTEGLRIGKLKHCKDKIENINWVNTPVKTVGVYFGHNREKCITLNWKNKIEQMKNLNYIMGKKKFINNWKNINNEIIDITKIYIYCRCSPR